MDDMAKKARSENMKREKKIRIVRRGEVAGVEEGCICGEGRVLVPGSSVSRGSNLCFRCLICSLRIVFEQSCPILCFAI